MTYGIVHAGGLVFKHRSPKAHGPWVNWHINRGRISHRVTAGECRRVSWRRAL